MDGHFELGINRQTLLKSYSSKYLVSKIVNLFEVMNIFKNNFYLLNV